MLGLAGCGEVKYEPPRWVERYEHCINLGGSYSRDDLGNEKCDMSS